MEFVIQQKRHFKLNWSYSGEQRALGGKEAVDGKLKNKQNQTVVSDKTEGARDSEKARHE